MKKERRKEDEGMKEGRKGRKMKEGRTKGRKGTYTFGMEGAPPSAGRKEGGEEGKKEGRRDNIDGSKEGI